MKIKFIDEKNTTLFTRDFDTELTEEDNVVLEKFDKREVTSVLAEFKEGQTIEMGIDFFNIENNIQVVKQLTVKLKD